MLGAWHRRLVHVPIRQVISQRNHVGPHRPALADVLGVTGQPLTLQ